MAEPLYLTKYIERMGTGTGDMIRRCRNVGLDEPEFALTDGFVVTIRRKPELAFKAVGGITPEVTPEVLRMIRVLQREMSRQALQRLLGLKDAEHFRQSYLLPAIHYSVIEMTIPDKPRSSKQKYRLTAKGGKLLEKLNKKGEE